MKFQFDRHIIISQIAVVGLALSSFTSCADHQENSFSHFKDDPVLGSADFKSHIRATTSTVYIVRHGEKPDSGPDLNDTGRQRAELLPTWFSKNPTEVTHGLPVAAFASGPSSDGGSLRSIQTCTPFASSQGIGVDSSYTKKDFADAAVEILTLPAASGKAVLVCWEHKMIPYLAAAMGAKDAPDSWDGDVFDRVWKIEFENGRVASFEDLPQRLLPGDSDR